MISVFPVTCFPRENTVTQCHINVSTVPRALQPREFLGRFSLFLSTRLQDNANIVTLCFFIPRVYYCGIIIFRDGLIFAYFSPMKLREIVEIKT
jgi:hypothetical protein